MRPCATDLIRALGGTSAVARSLGIKPPSVAEWKRHDRIPDDKLARLAGELEAKTRWRRWDLFPNTWHCIWPELVGAEGAPPAPQQAETLAVRRTESAHEA